MTPKPLTAAEREVCDLLRAGVAQKDIAQRRGVSKVAVWKMKQAIEAKGHVTAVRATAHALLEADHVGELIAALQRRRAEIDQTIALLTAMKPELTRP